MNEPSLNYELDVKRLRTQYDKVFDLMSDGVWRSLGEIRSLLSLGSEAGISARLREFRANGYQVNRRRRLAMSGLWEYQVIDDNS